MSDDSQLALRGVAIATVVDVEAEMPSVVLTVVADCAVGAGMAGAAAADTLLLCIITGAASVGTTSGTEAAGWGVGVAVGGRGTEEGATLHTLVEELNV